MFSCLPPGPPRVALVANLHCKLLFFSLEAGFVARLKKINIVDPNILRKKKKKIMFISNLKNGLVECLEWIKNE